MKWNAAVGLLLKLDLRIYMQLDLLVFDFQGVCLMHCPMQCSQLALGSLSFGQCCN